MAAHAKLRIYLGAAPGVGKTYAMLAEGRRLLAQGADVVIGFVEPHGRRPTAAMAEGIETVPRRTVLHRGAEFTEMDVDAVLARHPQVALVDELAHTNVPGSRNAKRWQDVEDLLDAGIDVVTTLNVQHLESLNDVVTQITGVRQRERLPDEVARRADQIELVDLPPEAVRRRMTHGDIYPPDRIEAALTHYFRIGNLTALRELALLWLADRVEEGLQRYRTEHGIVAPWETRERILVGLTGGREGETLIRRAARITARTPGSELLALHVAPGDALVDADPTVLAEQRALVESLGGSYHQTTADDVVQGLLDFARAENITQVVLGAGRRGLLGSLLRGDVGRRTIRDSGPIDVHVVTHEEAAGVTGLTLPRPGRGTGRKRFWPAVAGAAVLLPALTAVLTTLRDRLDLSSDLVLYLLAVVVVALVGGLGPALLAALAAGLLADYFFTTPVHTFGIERGNDILALTVFVAVAALVGSAAGLVSRRTYRATRVTAEAHALSRLATAMMHGRDLPALVEQLRENFGLTAVSLLERADDPVARPRWFVVASAGERPPERPYDADLESPIDEHLTLAARGRGLSADDQDIFAACAAQLGIAHAHGRIALQTAGTGTRETAERSRAMLIAVAVRDFRTSLAAISAALARLADPAADRPARERARLLAEARHSAGRAERLAGELDDLGRLQAGALELHLRPVDVGEVLTTVLDDLGPGGRTISVALPEDLPDVIADAAVLARVLTTVVTEALRGGGPDRSPVLTAQVSDGRLIMRMEGAGAEADAVTAPAGRTAGERTESLSLLLARDLVEAMGGAWEAGAGGHRGTGRRAVVFALPVVARRSGAADRSVDRSTTGARQPAPGDDETR
ncbi:sensor histidine kinase [Streptomyces sp. L500]